MPAVNTRLITGSVTSVPYTAYQARSDKDKLDLDRSEGRAVVILKGSWWGLMAWEVLNTSTSAGLGSS